MSFNPLDYPIAFTEPKRISPQSAWITHIPFAYALVQMLRPRTIVELGVHQGDSYCAFCQAVSTLGLATKCYGIDTWRGDAHAGFYPEQVLAALRSHHDPAYGSFSTLVQASFDEALPGFDRGSIDFLHIDGFHTYEAVRHDFDTWLPKMTDRGVIIFHDTVVRHKDFGVWKLWEEISPRHPSFNFEHGAGLGILAVGRHAPEPLLGFLKQADADPDGMKRFFCEVGMQIERKRLASSLITQLFHTQTLVNGWKKQFGMDVAPASTESRNAFANPHGYLRDMAQDLNQLLKAAHERVAAMA